MGRREELELELVKVQERIDSARPGTPDEITDALHRERDSIFIELNNLYDDDETETE